MEHRKPTYTSDNNSPDLLALSEDRHLIKENGMERRKGGRGLMFPALAAAVAAVSLPLLRVKPVEASSETCVVDSYNGFDTGDPGDCADCAASILSDCTPNDTNDNAGNFDNRDSGYCDAGRDYYLYGS